MPLAPLPPQVDFRLGRRLNRVATRLRAITFHQRSIAIWSGVALVAALLVVGQHRSTTLAHQAAPFLLAVFAVASGLVVWLLWRARTDFSAAARYVEKLHPELRSGLQAAVEQRPETNGQFHFLQRRVIDDALRHDDTTDWARQPGREARWLLAGHALAFVAALGFSLSVFRAHRPASKTTVAMAAAGFEVTPGDAEVERGSTVVIAARFEADAVPTEAELVWQPSDGAAQRATMHRSLSDPVFAFTLPSVTSDVAYHVEHDGNRTRTFGLTVFDRPALVRADATLDYPDYTGLVDRQIVDTRRVSAVIGTKLTYEFVVNKPLARATLVSANKTEIPLEATSPESTRFQLTTVIAQSDRFSLQLEDRAGRTNAAPIDIRIEALENHRPELKLIFPRGDQRVSPLEEMQLQAEARDDFGLRDYGFGLSIADGAPNYLSFAPPNFTSAVQASFDHLVALEKEGVKPDQLVTWFAWADDVGPDGLVRRTTSDVSFAEVRRLEEIFREDANGGGENQAAGGGNGGPGEELIETQRQISIATWKLRQQDAKTPNFSADVGTLRDSQVQAQEQLKEVRERLDEPRARAAADEAAPLMKKAEDALSEAVSKKSTASLDSAWASARGAYQALLRMQSRDTNVSQSRGKGQGGSSRNRSQLNELQFRDENDRYETETQAQPPPTPEQREQLGVLARLRELARRQQDINQRLQELQTALAAAEDEAKREAIRRELKRLEDEQRNMLSEVDEARQRVDRLQPGEQSQQARQQLDRTREDMRRASEQLAKGEVSQALAAGSRAQENLRKTSEDLRKEAAGRFGDQMREARRQARELQANQQDANRKLEHMSKGQQSLDDAAKREDLAQQFEEQVKRREGLLENLRQVTEESEGTEPRLHRQLYDLLRQQGQSGAGRELTTSAELLRRGFVEPAVERQATVGRDIEQLQKAVERAAGSVLGDETNELRFAQSELDALTKELQRDRNPSAEGEKNSSGGSKPGEAGQPGSRAEGDERVANAKDSREGENPSTSPAESGEASSSKTGTPSPLESAAGERPGKGNASGENLADGNTEDEKAGSESNAGGNAPSGNTPGGNAGGGQGGSDTSLEQLARELGGASRGGEPARGPLTGGGFGDWAERLRTVEELMEAPELRQQLAGARTQAEEFRRANQREGKPPRWDLVEVGVVAPLQEARAWLRQELNRREQPDALHPIDRDPVPERYAESVRKYYEALGEDKSGQ